MTICGSQSYSQCLINKSLLSLTSSHDCGGLWPETQGWQVRIYSGTCLTPTPSLFNPKLSRLPSITTYIFKGSLPLRTQNKSQCEKFCKFSGYPKTSTTHPLPSTFLFSRWFSLTLLMKCVCRVPELGFHSEPESPGAWYVNKRMQLFTSREMQQIPENQTTPGPYPQVTFRAFPHSKSKANLFIFLSV